jgi:hypothetical protein
MHYKPREMPKRFTEGVPEKVRRDVIDIIKITPAAPLDYDVVFRHVETLPGWRSEMVGLDFGQHGERGCHFFLEPHQMRDYRGRNRRKRVAWKDLPNETQASIIAYVGEEESDFHL